MKLRPGGGMEVEFIAQTLQLVHRVPTAGRTTAEALRHLAEIGALPAAEAATLVQADRLWRTVQSILRITVGRATDAVPAAAMDALLRATGAVVGFGLDAGGLDATLERTARDVRAIFITRIGAIA